MALRPSGSETSDCSSLVRQDLLDLLGNNDFFAGLEVVWEDPEALPCRAELGHVAGLDRGLALAEPLHHLVESNAEAGFIPLDRQSRRVAVIEIRNELGR